MVNAEEVLGSAGTGQAAVHMIDFYWIKLTLPRFVFPPAVEILGGLGGGSQPLAGMAPGLKKKGVRAVRIVLKVFHRHFHFSQFVT